MAGQTMTRRTRRAAQRGPAAVDAAFEDTLEPMRRVPRVVRARPTPISPRVHGALDYATSAAVAAAPYMFGFPRQTRLLCESLAGGYTSLSAFTNYPLSIKRAIPFKAHGATELAIAAALPAMPWILGFSGHRAARNLCFGLTALTIIVAALTDWGAEQ